MLGATPTATRFRLPLQQLGGSTKSPDLLQRLSWSVRRGNADLSPLAAVDRWGVAVARLLRRSWPKPSGNHERPHQRSPDSGEVLASKYSLPERGALSTSKHDHRCAPEQPGEHSTRRHPQSGRADGPGWAPAHVCLDRKNSSTDNPIWFAFSSRITSDRGDSASSDFPARPRGGKSGATRTLSVLRAIPWVFRRTPERFLLPSWFGVGAALPRELRAVTRASMEVACGCVYSGWPFLPDVDLKVEMTLSEVDLDLANHYR